MTELERTTTDEYTPSAARYVAVWVLLVVLATVTLLASSWVGGAGGFAIGLVIATAKAALVAAFFMHLAGGRALHRIVFAVAIGFVVLLVLGVLGDVGTRSVASPYMEDAHQRD